MQFKISFYMHMQFAVVAGGCCENFSDSGWEMLSDNLPIVKDLPSPQGRWELVEVIGEYVCEVSVECVHVKENSSACIKSSAKME